MEEKLFSVEELSSSKYIRKDRIRKSSFCSHQCCNRLSQVLPADGKMTARDWIFTQLPGITHKLLTTSKKKEVLY